MGSGMIPYIPFERVLVSSYKPSIHSSISTCLPEIFDCAVEWGLRTPNFWEGEVVGGRGWYRSKERW